MAWFIRPNRNDHVIGANINTKTYCRRWDIILSLQLWEVVQRCGRIQEMFSVQILLYDFLVRAVKYTRHAILFVIPTFITLNQYCTSFWLRFDDRFYYYVWKISNLGIFQKLKLFSDSLTCWSSCKIFMMCWFSHIHVDCDVTKWILTNSHAF